MHFLISLYICIVGCVTEDLVNEGRNLLLCTVIAVRFMFQAATKEVEKDFESVYSRLVLCKTYRYNLFYKSRIM